jgi:hypothetical protein
MPQLGPAPLLPFPSDNLRYAIAPAIWVQRAVNAWRAANPGNGALIVVDGLAGPITIRAINRISPTYTNNLNYPIGERVTQKVVIERGLHDRLALLPRVSDPQPASSTTGTTPTPTPDTAATTTGTSADPPLVDAGGGVLIDSGSGGSSGGGGMMLLGAVALVGLLLFAGSRDR